MSTRIICKLTQLLVWNVTMSYSQNISYTDRYLVYTDIYSVGQFVMINENDVLMFAKSTPVDKENCPTWCRLSGCETEPCLWQMRFFYGLFFIEPCTLVWLVDICLAIAVLDLLQEVPRFCQRNLLMLMSASHKKCMQVYVLIVGFWLANPFTSRSPGMSCCLQAVAGPAPAWTMQYQVSAD